MPHRRQVSRRPRTGTRWKGDCGRRGSLVLSPPQLCPKKSQRGSSAARAETSSNRGGLAPATGAGGCPGRGAGPGDHSRSVHSESGLSICGQSHCRTSAKPRLVVMATSLPISAGFRPKAFNVVAAEKGFPEYFPPLCCAIFTVPVTTESVISPTDLGLSPGLGLALWPRLLLHHSPAHRTRPASPRLRASRGLRPDVTFVRPDRLSCSQRVQGFLRVSTYSSSACSPA